MRAWMDKCIGVRKRLGRLRARIAELERDLVAITPQGRHRPFEAGHELCNAKCRLKRLEECIAEIPEKCGR